MYEAEYSGLLRPDDETPETSGLIGTEAAGVHPCGRPRIRCELICQMLLSVQPVTVSVEINEARGDIKTGRVNDIDASVNEYTWINNRYFSVKNAHIGALPKPSPQIENFAVLD